MATDSLNANEILASFREWSTEEQVALIRSLVSEVAAHERRLRQGLSVYDLAGIARRTSSIPTDEQVGAWLDERRAKEGR